MSLPELVLWGHMYHKQTLCLRENAGMFILRSKFKESYKSTSRYIRERMTSGKIACP